MKRVYFILPGILSLFFSLPGFSQCGGSCPTGSLTSLPSTGVIAAGSTYCISGTVNDASVNFTVSGTLIIQSGTVTLGTVTLNKTGAIIVNSGARLYTNSFTGESTAPASLISNVVICSGSYMSISGSFNQWETNFVLKDYGILLVTGSWTSSSTDVYAQIGAGALVEVCGTLNINTNGFFTETSSSSSYLVTDGGVSQSDVNGWISTKQAASLIKWTTLAPTAFVSHPAAYTCAICGNSSMAPPGTTPGSCGAVANNYVITTLPTVIEDFYQQPDGAQLQFTGLLDQDLPAGQVVLESASDGAHFMTGSWIAQTTGTAYSFSTPSSEAVNYHRLRVLNDGRMLYSKVLPPSAATGDGGVKVWPVPGRSYVNVLLPEAGKYSSVALLDELGRVRAQQLLPATAGTIRFDWPADLSTGVYFVRLTGEATGPLLVRVLKVP